MDFFINIIFFILTCILTQFFFKKIKCKELSLLCAGLGIWYFFSYLAAKYFRIGIAIMGKNQAIANPDNVIKSGPPFITFMVALFIIAYVFEWWYYKYFLPKKGVSSSEELKQKYKENHNN